MHKFRSLSEYYQAAGITHNSSDTEITAAKKAYLKLYHKSYYQERKNQQKRFTVRMVFDEYDRLEAFAKLHGELSVNQFIKAAAFAYLDQYYIPRDPTQIEKAILAFSRIGNNINQIVRAIHQSKKYHDFMGYAGAPQTLQVLDVRYTELVHEVESLREELRSFLSHPPQSISTALVTYLQEDPQAIDQIQQLISKLKKIVADGNI